MSYIINDGGAVVWDDDAPPPEDTQLEPLHEVETEEPTEEPKTKAKKAK